MQTNDRRGLEDPAQADESTVNTLIADGGTSVTWSDLNQGQRHVLERLDGADGPLCAIDVAREAHDASTRAPRHIYVAIGRLRGLGLVEETDALQYRLTARGRAVLRSRGDQNRHLVTDGGQVSYRDIGPKSSGGGVV